MVGDGGQKKERREGRGRHPRRVRGVARGRNRQPARARRRALVLRRGLFRVQPRRLDDSRRGGSGEPVRGLQHFHLRESRHLRHDGERHRHSGGALRVRGWRAAGLLPAVPLGGAVAGAQGVPRLRRGDGGARDWPPARIRARRNGRRLRLGVRRRHGRLSRLGVRHGVAVRVRRRSGFVFRVLRPLVRRRGSGEPVPVPDHRAHLRVRQRHRRGGGGMRLPQQGLRREGRLLRRSHLQAGRGRDVLGD